MMAMADHGSEQLYDILHDTARAFVESTGYGNPPATYKGPTSGRTEQDNAHILSFRTPDCMIEFGHRLFASSNPMTNKALNNDEFLANMAPVLPFLSSVQTEVHDILVDERCRRATVQMTFHMTVRGAGEDGKDETVENDMMWVLEMDDSGRRVRRGKEYLDAVATGKMGKLIGKVKQATGKDY